MDRPVFVTVYAYAGRTFVRADGRHFSQPLTDAEERALLAEGRLVYPTRADAEAAVARHDRSAGLLARYRS